MSSTSTVECKTNILLWYEGTVASEKVGRRFSAEQGEKPQKHGATH